MKDIFSYYQVEDANEEHLKELLDQLPPVKKKASLSSQLYLQWKTTPLYVYILFLVLWILFSLYIHAIIPQHDMTPKEMDAVYYVLCLYMSSQVLLMLPQMVRSQLYGCEELERSCTFHYIQLLCYRILLFSALLLCSGSIATILIVHYVPLPFLKVYSLMLETLMLSISLTELMLLLVKQRDLKIMMLLYIFSSMMVMILILPNLLREDLFSNGVVLLIGMLFAGMLSKKIWKEIKEYEIISPESYKELYDENCS